MGARKFVFEKIYNPKILKLSQKRFTNALLAEGIPIGTNYGCLVSTWKWTKKYFKKVYKSRNALNTRNQCFHLYLNENYRENEVKDIVNAIIKIENYFLKLN